MEDGGGRSCDGRGFEHFDRVGRHQGPDVQGSRGQARRRGGARGRRKGRRAAGYGGGGWEGSIGARWRAGGCVYLRGGNAVSHSSVSRQACVARAKRKRGRLRHSTNTIEAKWKILT